MPQLRDLANFRVAHLPNIGEPVTIMPHNPQDREELVRFFNRVYYGSGGEADVFERLGDGIRACRHRRWWITSLHMLPEDWGRLSGMLGLDIAAWALEHVSPRAINSAPPPAAPRRRGKPLPRNEIEPLPLP